MLEEGKISEWTIPSRNVENPDKVITDHRPIFTFADLMHGDNIEYPDSLPDNPWVSRSHLLKYMTLIRNDDLSLIEMEPRSSCYATLPEVDLLPRHIKTHIDKYSLGQFVQGARFCDKHLVFTSRESRVRRDIKISVIPTIGSLEPCSVITEYLSSKCRHANQASLCSATGRMCILMDNNEIVILDFLEAPTS